jgi:hypothetical protein
MPKDPIGVLGRLNAVSLMMITPEFYKLWSKRAKGAGKINHELSNFTIKPANMQLDGLKIRYATGGNSDGPTVLFLSPQSSVLSPQSSSSKYPVLRCDVVSALYQY